MPTKAIIRKSIEQELYDFHETCHQIEVYEKRTHLTTVETVRLKEMKRIREAIQYVYQTRATPKRELMDVKYFERGVRTWDNIAARLFIGRMTAFRWRDEIVQAIADQLGWEL